MKPSLINAKQAKITLYVITGILILFAVIIYLLVSSLVQKLPNIQSTITLQEQSKNIEEYTKSCLTNLFEDSLIIIGKQGGYFNLPSDHFKNDFLRASYLFNQNSMLLTKEDLKKELSQYIVANYNKYCTFREFKLRIDSNKISPDIALDNDKSTLIPNLVLTISKKQESIQLKDFEIEVPIRLNLIYDLIQEILSDLYRSNLNIPQGIKIRIIQYNSDLLYIISDEQSKIKNKEDLFLFAVKE